MNCFGLIKFVTGIFLALALLFVGGAAAARYLITRLTTPPPKPVFVEEQTSQSSDSASSDTSVNDVSTSDQAPTTDEQLDAEVSENPANEPTEVFADLDEPESTVSVDASEAESSEPEAAERDQPTARITQSIGMVLRQSPSQDATRIGGLYYNDEVIVIGESADGQWQQVRLPGSGVEGWIKAGNVEQLN